MQSLIHPHFGTNGQRFFLPQKCCRSFKVRTNFMLIHLIQHLGSLYNHQWGVQPLKMNGTLKCLCVKDCRFTTKTSVFEKKCRGKSIVLTYVACFFTHYLLTFFYSLPKKITKFHASFLLGTFFPFFALECTHFIK